MFYIPLKKYFIKASNIINYSNKWEGKNIPLGLLEIKKSLKAMPSHSMEFFLKVKEPAFFIMVIHKTINFLEKICADIKH